MLYLAFASYVRHDQVFDTMQLMFTDIILSGQSIPFSFSYYYYIFFVLQICVHCFRWGACGLFSVVGGCWNYFIWETIARTKVDSSAAYCQNALSSWLENRRRRLLFVRIVRSSCTPVNEVHGDPLPVLCFDHRVYLGM